MSTLEIGRHTATILRELALSPDERNMPAIAQAVDGLTDGVFAGRDQVTALFNHMLTRGWVERDGAAALHTTSEGKHQLALYTEPGR